MANDPNEQLRNQMGNEYDLYSSLKDKFQGFDKDGHAIFKDDAGTTSFDKNDFSKMNSQLRKDFGNKSYEDTFNQNQFEDIKKQGNTFQGFAGDQAIFRNEKGDLENFGNQGGFSSFLKKQQPNTQFDMSKQGQSNRTSQNYNANIDFLQNKQNTQQKTGSGFTGYNPQQHTANVARKMMNPSEAAEESEPSSNPNIPEPGSVPTSGSGSFSKFKSKQRKPIALSNEPESEADYSEEEPAQLPNKSPTFSQMAAGAAKDAAKKYTSGKVNEQKAIFKNQAMGKASGALQSGKSNFKGMLPPVADPTGGALSGMSQYKSLAGGNVSKNIQNLAMQKAKQGALAQGKGLLAANDPTGGALSGAAQYAGLLKGNVGSNAKNMAVDQGKQAAFTAAGLDPNMAKALLGGGSSSDKGQALAEGSARTALSAMTGGFANPELLHAGSALSDKLAGKMGGTGVLLKPGSAALDLGAKALDTGIGGAGAYGATTGRAFSAAGSGLKSIAHGNIEEGLKGLGTGAAKAAVETFLKNPATIAGGVGNLGKAAVEKAKEAAKALISSPGKVLGSAAGAVKNVGTKAVSAVKNVVAAVFCFTPDTEILMADGKYKKIKYIKLHDEIMLGGKVTAIGQSTSDDLYYYDGVTVSGDHTLYEDRVWKRVKESKFSVKLDNKESLVYPMATENHLIVTKGQVWADMEEVDNTYNKTDTDILKELNSQSHANAMLDIFLSSYFKKKKK